MSTFKTTPDFAVRKSNGGFSPVITSTLGVVEWDFGDGNTILSNTPNHTFTGTTPPYLINALEADIDYYDDITGIDMSSQSLTSIDVSRFKNLLTLDVSDNSLAIEDINGILITLDANGLSNGTLDYSNTIEEGDSEEAQIAYDNLVAKGWTITGDRPLSSMIITVDLSLTGGDSDKFRLPIGVTSGSYDAYFDGTSVLGITTSGTTYLTFPSGVGVYDIKIVSNDCVGRWWFNSYNTDKLRIIDIKQWGSEFTHNNFHQAFRQCSNLGINGISATDAPIFTITSLTNVFEFATGMTSIDVSKWDVSSVTNFTSMFDNCVDLITIDGLENWDTSSATNMSNLFEYCLDLVDLSGVENWDMSNVTTVTGMFRDCRSITTLNLSNWNTDKIANASVFIYNNLSLTSLDISTWVLPVCTTFSNFVALNPNLTTLDCGLMNPSGNVNCSAMFSGCSSLVSVDLSSLSSTITNASSMFSNCSSLTTIIGHENFNLASSAHFSSMFSSCSSLVSLDPSSWDTSSSTNFSTMFNFCSSLSSIDLSSFSNPNGASVATMFYGCSSLTTLDVSTVGTTSSSALNFIAQCTSLTTVTLPISGMQPTTCQQVFDNCTSLTTINNLDAIDMSNCTSIAYFFRACDSLTNIDVSNWEGSFSTLSTFDGCDLLTTITLPISGMQSTTTQLMFQSSPLLTTINNLNSLDTSLVTNASDMFNNCDSLTSLDMSNMDFSNCDNFFRMVDNCDLLETFDGTGLILAKPSTNLTEMFDQCTSLTTTIGISGWDVSNGIVDVFTHMFRNCNLDTQSYDQILTGWSALTLSQSESINFGSSEYSPGAIESGTTTGTGVNQLIDSTQDFTTTLSISGGDYIFNSTQTQYAKVTSVDSDTQLTIDSDVMGNTEDYIIIKGGTTDGTTSLKLIDSTQNFLTSVSIGDIIFNDTDNTFAKVTNVDSDTQLTLDVDIMVSGELYLVLKSDGAKGRYRLTKAVGLGGANWSLTDGGFVGQV